ncbi:hypothetical protein C8R47DRAFT_1199911 [Mycena vitilis]|nr:hypothetical protein C8R47DRAFT_1199911 [Mycena vitilis]
MSQNQDFPTPDGPTLSTSSLLSTPSPGRQRATRVPCPNPTCSHRGHRNGFRNLACVLLWCAKCCQTSGKYCPAPHHNEPAVAVLDAGTVVSRTPTAPNPTSSSSSSTTVAFTFERPMGKSIDPTFARKLLNNEHDPNVGGTGTDRFQREVYRKQNINSINIQWWIEDGQEPIALIVAAPAYPMFHPKDCPPIADLVELRNCVYYSYWDGNRWLLTDVAMEIKGNSVVYMRSPKVKNCVGGPVSKRRLSNSEDGPTPTRMRLNGPRPFIRPIDFADEPTTSPTPTPSPSPSPVKSSAAISIASTDTDRRQCYRDRR